MPNAFALPPAASTARCATHRPPRPGCACSQNTLTPSRSFVPEARSGRRLCAEVPIETMSRQFHRCSALEANMLGLRKKKADSAAAKEAAAHAAPAPAPAAAAAAGASAAAASSAAPKPAGGGISLLGVGKGGKAKEGGAKKMSAAERRVEHGEAACHSAMHGKAARKKLILTPQPLAPAASHGRGARGGSDCATAVAQHPTRGLGA